MVVTTLVACCDLTTKEQILQIKWGRLVTTLVADYDFATSELMLQKN